MNVENKDLLPLVKKLRIKNSQGLHTRPATYIVKLLQNTKSEIFFTYNKFTINAKSILSLLMLAAKKNSTIKVTIRGRDAEEVMKQLIEAFETNFGE
jgi:phosphocarrier protein HPr